MICQDCAEAADGPILDRAAWPPDQLAKVIQAGHELCRVRNEHREFGQLPDCTCQHVVNAQMKESRTP